MAFWGPTGSAAPRGVLSRGDKVGASFSPALDRWLFGVLGARQWPAAVRRAFRVLCAHVRCLSPRGAG
eukprot:5219514-Pyramimonas_sp.AAC.1